MLQKFLTEKFSGEKILRINETVNLTFKTLPSSSEDTFQIARTKLLYQITLRRKDKTHCTILALT